ncbi:unnamed protein product [Somion occarium]|uniref:F-box domain-containing protein n=1 Tax=Somion occarium TaxID=3059160 RepID=A0ABP1DYR2_9APHY
MDKCPPEIHARIFAFACTDDGTTGRSLSHVSRYIRIASFPYQWQSLCLVGAKCVTRFAELTSVAEERRSIHHLFISDDAEGLRPPHAAYNALPNDLPCKSVHDVLSYAAATLQTLTFFSSAHYHGSAVPLSHLLAIHYPNLTELTIRSHCTPVQLASTASNLKLSLCEVPSLQRLHLAIPCHGFSYGNLERTRELVHTIGPNITHFRVSMLDRWGGKRVAEVVHAELAQLKIVNSTIDLSPIDADLPQFANAPEVTWNRLLPESLEMFVLQPSPTLNFYCSCCMEFRGDLDVMRLFDRLSEEGEGSLFLYIAPFNMKCKGPMNNAGYGAEEAMVDWLERIRDTDGCWQRRDEQPEDLPSNSRTSGPIQSVPAIVEPRDPPRRSRGKRRSFVISGIRKLVEKFRI